MLEEKMSLFLYRRQETIFHALNPAVKIIILLLCFTAASAAGSVPAAVSVFAGLIAMFFISSGFYSLNRMLGLLLTIAGMTFLLWMVFYEGKTLWIDLKAVKIYHESLPHAVLMSVKFVNMLLSGILFLSYTSLEEFSDGLLLLGAPYRAAFAISLSFRLVLIFVSSGFLIVEAQKVRGNDIERGGIFSRIRSYAPLLIPLILNGIKRAETLALALESKGFSPDNRIDIKGKYGFGAADIITLAVVTAAAVAAVTTSFS
jgi:energy-coupling factor transport system permease protein